MKTQKNILGVVLCGGTSTRMGADKGSLKRGYNRWVNIAREKFNECQLSSVVSVNSNQLPEYVKIFEERELIVDDKTLKVHGPLLGVLSVHQKFPERDLIVLACDMINMNSMVIKKLLTEFMDNKFEAIAFKDDRVQPLCAIYSSIGLKKILDFYLTDQLQKFSMTHTLEIVDTRYLLLQEEWIGYFKNLNSPDDIAKD